MCRISVAGLNQSRHVVGAIHAECPDQPLHSAPFGNWGVTSNFGQRGNSHQFDGWCHDITACDNSGACRPVCADGWYEWNTCTDIPLFSAPNCSLYNSASCTEQVTTTGINVHGTRLVDMPVACPRDTDGDGVPDAGGCRDVAQYSSGANFMSLYELDPVCCDQLVQTVYFPAVTLPLFCDPLGCAPVASNWLDPSFWDSPSTPGKVYAQLAVLVNWGAFVNTGGNCSVAAASASVVSAASFTGPAVAPDSIATLFGTQLAPTTAEASSIPLPTELAGVSVSIADAAGVPRPASLLYVSPRQINLVMPAGLAPGAASVTVQSAGVTRAVGQLQVEPVAPGVFTQNMDGKGAPAAIVVRYASDGSTHTELAFDCTAGAGKCVPAPINPGSAGDQVYLLLFGTGIRHSSLNQVSVTIGGASVAVEYAGAQGQFVGLDQVNVRLSPDLRARGTVDLQLTVASRPANVVQLNFR